MKNYPLLSQKEGGGVKHPKSAKNSTILDWAQIFRAVQAQQMIKAGAEKFDPL